MNNTQLNQLQPYRQLETLTLIASMLPKLYEATEVSTLPLFVASDKQTLQGILPLHLRHLCTETYELYTEILERHENEKDDFHKVGIKPKTKMWFKHHVYKFAALSMTLFSSIVCRYPVCLDNNTVTITRDWKVVTEEEDYGRHSFELLGMKLGEINNIMELVNQYKVIATETEPEKPNDRFVQDMM